MDFLELGKEIIKRGAPILGSAFGAPGAAVGAIVANVFGADPYNPDDILKKIEGDPAANLKLFEIQSNNKIQLEQLALQRQIAENADRESARKANNENTKMIDSMIKAYLVFAMSFVILVCLYALIQQDVRGEEANIISTILGSAFTALLSMVYFYWGSSSSSKAKDTALIEKVLNA